MKKLSMLLSVLLSALILSSCGNKNTAGVLTASGEKMDSSVSTADMDFTFTKSDTEYGYDESEAKTVSDSEENVKITAEGTYVISGSHSSVTVDAPQVAKVKLVLKNADISNQNGPAIYVKSADKVFITAYENTVNSVSDGGSYSSDYEGTNVDGAVFSKADLTLNGEGTLNINGNYKCAVVSKDDLVICGLTLNAKSTGSAVEGKDCVKIKDAVLTVNAGSDAIKSTNGEDANRGFVYIESGICTLTAANDGIQAETVIKLSGGEITVTAGGGATEKAQSGNGGMRPFDSSTANDEESTKGIKATKLIFAEGGSVNVNSADDSIHSNGDIEINGGKFTLSSGDDGIHADGALIINGGEISVIKSYEGLEGKTVTVTSGTVDITASDDGINAADGSGTQGGRMGGNTSGDVYIDISGGYITVNASGDGVDSNSSITVSGGVLLVSGPEDSGNSALDCDGTAVITGGTVVLCGSSGMAESFSDSSTQASLMYSLASAAKAGSSVALSDSDGRVIASFVPSKQYSNVIISSPELKKGSSYTLSLGGTVTECDKNGYTVSGKVSGAESEESVEISSISTVYGTSGGNMGGMNKGKMQGSQGKFGGGESGGNQPAEPPEDSGNAERKAPRELPGNTNTAQS